MGNKITKATFKSFIRKNQGRLHISVKSRFNGMTDGVESTGDNSFSPIVAEDDFRVCDNNLGICGVWLVGSSRDYFSVYEGQGFTGIEVYNCCGSFVLAVPA